MGEGFPLTISCGLVEVQISCGFVELKICAAQKIVKCRGINDWCFQEAWKRWGHRGGSLVLTHDIHLLSQHPKILITIDEGLSLAK